MCVYYIMEELGDSKIYRLNLNSVTGFPNILDNSNKASVSWQVDFDSLFNRENYKYQNCRLRYKLQSHPQAHASLNHTNNIGILAVNGLVSPYSSKNTPMLVLDQILPHLATSLGWFELNTMDEVGVDILMPYGLGTINPQFYFTGFGCPSDGFNILQTFTGDYLVTFAFELYNPK